MLILGGICPKQNQSQPRALWVNILYDAVQLVLTIACANSQIQTLFPMNFPTSTVYTKTTSPLGSVILSATDIGLSGIWFDGQKHLPPYKDWQLSSNNAYLLQAKNSLQAYFSNKTKRFDIPLDLHAGTAFQQQVWLALLKIPYGRTVTYREISQYIGAPSSLRAVAGAVGRNPLSIMVPCHRVIGSDGTLTGYAGGLDRKLALLTLEGACT